jgi:hypothetical protein
MPIAAAVMLAKIIARFLPLLFLQPLLIQEGSMAEKTKVRRKTKRNWK